MKNDPAFPFLFPAGENNESLGAHVGLTKREYFAAMAMQGYLASYAGLPDAQIVNSGVAEASVKIADALIAELSKSEGGEG